MPRGLAATRKRALIICVNGAVFVVMRVVLKDLHHAIVSIECPHFHELEFRI